MYVNGGFFPIMVVEAVKCRRHFYRDFCHGES